GLAQHAADLLLRVPVLLPVPGRQERDERPAVLGPPLPVRPRRPADRLDLHPPRRREDEPGVQRDRRPREQDREAPAGLPRPGLPCGGRAQFVDPDVVAEVSGSAVSVADPRIPTVWEGARSSKEAVHRDPRSSATRLASSGRRTTAALSVV